MSQCMLTTIDNPYNPFEDFDSWYSYDSMLARQQNRPTCCSYLARVCNVANDVSEKEYEQVYNDAVDEICALNLSGTYKKIYQNKQENITPT